jgi:putative DNA primase/helicase
MSSRPHALPVRVEHIPAELRPRPQWVAWRYELRKGKWTKVLKNPRTGDNAKSDDAATWGTFEEALACSRTRRMDGVGFVFSILDEFAGIDLDHCRDPLTGIIAPWALAIIEAMHSYTEISPSHAGVKIFLRGRITSSGNRKGQIEMYDHHRYFTVTGYRLLNLPATLESRHAELTAWHARLFPEPHRVSPPLRPELSQRQTIAACSSEDELLTRALGARNGDHFAQLWAGDVGSYPSHSEADLAFCAMLAFWCGPDPIRIDTLFRRSGLYREKWDERHYGDGRAYGQATVAQALAHGQEMYTGRPALAVAYKGYHGYSGYRGGGTYPWISARARRPGPQSRRAILLMAMSIPGCSMVGSRWWSVIRTTTTLGGCGARSLRCLTVCR